MEVSEQASTVYRAVLAETLAERIYDRNADPENAARMAYAIADRDMPVREMMMGCGSPIEQTLLAGLCFIADGMDDLIRLGAPDDDGMYLEGQGAVGKYRADFLVTIRYGAWKRVLAIECDGHDFHERTKEQATRDKKRDRDFVAVGVQVIRFTGSEIFRDPLKAIAECNSLVYSMWTDTFSEWIRKGKPPVPWEPQGGGFRARSQDAAR